MRKYLGLLLVAFCASAYGLSNDNQALYNKLDEIKFTLQTGVTVTGGGGDASAANQTSVQANPGSDAAKAVSVQGITGGKAIPVSGTIAMTGAANFAASQTAISTSATSVSAARATRRGGTVKNMDASITIYIGGPSVTTTNGFELKAGESIPVDTNAAIYAIAASGTPRVSVLETYD